MLRWLIRQVTADEQRAHGVHRGLRTGKRTIGKVVAAELGCDFAEGDDMHPQTNLDKMRGGTPLTDEDRRPWLRAVAAWTRARRTPASCT